MAADKEKILKISGLSAAYEDVNVINSVSLDVYKGEVLCIVGESGSGKSTLIKAICADTAVSIKEGSITYKDKVLTDLKRRDMQKLLGCEIGLIQQNPWGAFNPIRRIDVQFKETFRSHGKFFHAERIKEIFEVLGLKDPDKILKMRPYELSGGMSQRIAIAAAFVLNPKLLLCDEITSALDVTIAMQVMQQLMVLKKQQETTIIMVTHNLGLAKCIADRIAIMYEGKIVECAEASDILKDPQDEYTKRLISDVPRLRAI